MLDLEELKLKKKKADEKLIVDFEKKYEKFLKKMESDLIKNIERYDPYYELDLAKYKKEFKANEESFYQLQRYLEVKGFDTYSPNINLINIYFK